jgi:hypothetical protein
MIEAKGSAHNSVQLGRRLRHPASMKRRWQVRLMSRTLSTIVEAP